METDPLLSSGRYGVADTDTKVRVIDELGKIIRDNGLKPVLFGGMAVVLHGYKRATVDVDLLLSRADARALSRLLEAHPSFAKIRSDCFRHKTTGRTIDLCVEGEQISPYHQDPFPAPGAVEQLPRDPIPVIGLTDLLAIKVMANRAQDEADFIQLYRIRGLTSLEIERVGRKLQDPKLKELLTRWQARAEREIEQDKLRRPPSLD
jgi:hypothetical protein